MAITVTEHAESRTIATGAYPSADLKYIIRGTSSDTLAAESLRNTAPVLYDLYQDTPDAGIILLARKSVQVSPVHVDTECDDDCIWEGLVEYGFTNIPGESIYEFDTLGGTQHVLYSLETVASYKPSWWPFPVPNYKGAIGVTADSVDGCDITVPVYNFAETHYLADVFVNDAYKFLLFAWTGCVNSEAWRSYAAGEVLFLGASGAKRGTGEWELTYRFAALPNVPSIQIGDIAVGQKDGWDYLWVRFQDRLDEAANYMVKHPMSVHIERVYRRKPFSSLGIDG